jgi:hypothetical protein
MDEGTVAEDIRASENARKYLAFDVETAHVRATDNRNWRADRPLGISCVASLLEDPACASALARSSSRDSSIKATVLTGGGGTSRLLGKKSPPWLCHCRVERHWVRL